MRSRGGTGARGARSRGRAAAAPCQAVPHGGLSKPELGLLPPPAPSPCSGLGLTVRARFPREPAPSRASAHALGSLEQSGTGRSDTNPALANCHRWHAGGGDEGRGCPINKYAYNKSEMLEQRCRRKWVWRKKAAKPPPVPRATPRCSPPSAHLRAGLGHPLALPGPRGLPGAGRAVTTGLVTAHAPLSKACSQLPLAAALPPAGDTAGTQPGHGRDGQRTERGPHGGGCGDKGGAPGPQQHCRAAGLKQSGCKKLPTTRSNSPGAQHRSCPQPGRIWGRASPRGAGGGLESCQHSSRSPPTDHRSEAAALLRAGLAPQARRSLQGLLSFPLQGLGTADKLRTTAVLSCEVSAPVPAGPAPGGTRRWGDPPGAIPYLCFPATAWPWGCGGLPAASAQLLLQTEGR